MNNPPGDNGSDTNTSFLVRSAFDGIADRFDSELENAVTLRVRNRIYTRIESLVEKGSSILDVNCGTGIDAVNLTMRGYSVSGVDVSPRMIEQARTKARRLRLHDLRFDVCPYEHLTLRVSYRSDLVLSNFGGLNCTNNLSAVAKEIADVTLPDGHLLAVVMPPFCLWESSSFLAHRKWSEILRRSRNTTLATGFGFQKFPVHYHSPASLIHAFRPWFVPEELAGLCVVSPSPQSMTFVRTHPRLSLALEKLDKGIARWPLLRSIGDHYMLVLRRKPL